MNLEEKQKLRKYCRRKLFEFEDYFENEYEDFLQTLMTNITIPFDIDKSSIYLNDLQNLTSNELREFVASPSSIEFTPNLQACEHKFKEMFLKGIEMAHSFSKLKLDEVIQSPYPFNFESLKPEITTTIELIDEFLSDSFLSLIAVQHYLKGFEHLLLFEEKKLLEDEVLKLKNENNFEPLKEEIDFLKEDEKYLSLLSKFIFVGLFKVDVEGITSLMKTRIEKAVKDCFENVIKTKFRELLETNSLLFDNTRFSLMESIDSIQSYIEMKSLLKSQDLKETIENIENDINLCRDIYDFLEKHLQNTHMLMLEYLRSLNWVRDLNRMQVDAWTRLKEETPKFILEQKRESEMIMEELNSLQREAKRFEAYSDLHYAEEYYRKAEEINSRLTELQTRSIEVNKKQDILECKETDFETIGTEIKNFKKYFDLWDFIAVRWSPNQEKWWKGPFVDLKQFEMQSILNYGSELLKRLSDEFSSPNDVPIQEIIKTRQVEVTRHTEIYNHISILKDPCFKDRHWEAFFMEVRDQDKGGDHEKHGKLR